MYTFLFSGYGQAHLYLTDSGRDDIYKMSLTDGSMVPLKVCERVRMSGPMGIAYDKKKNWLYWTDDILKIIGRISLTDCTVDTMNLTSGKLFF